LLEPVFDFIVLFTTIFGRNNGSKPEA